MFNKFGIKIKVLLNSFVSVFIFAIFLVWLVNIYWGVLLNNKREKLQSIVELGSTLVDSYIQLEKKKELTKEEAQKRALANILALRYSNNDYIFISNTKSEVVLVPPKPEMSGKDMSNFADPTGFKIYANFSEVAKKSGSGFVEYMFPKAGSSEPVKKLSYIKYMPDWDWIVGTGLYMDDAYNALFDFMKILLFACVFCMIVLIFIGIYFSNSVIKPLVDVCQYLLSSSKTLSNKSDELKKSSGSVKSYSKEQESSIQTTAAAISEITSMIGKTTELTTNSANLANSISTKAVSGEVSMKNMITSMHSIHEASSKLKDIENIINEIEIKTQVITEIVSKTELLSLNASIEAARAGEHGKGFSVVAEEVGNLAHLSGKSSAEIHDLLQKSRDEVQHILAQTIERVEDGEKRTLKVSESFTEIVEGIKEINHQIDQVSSATKEQEIGVKQISTAMGKLDQLAFKNAEESENSLKVTDEISNESNNLNNIVSKTENVIYGFHKKAN